MTGYRW